METMTTNNELRGLIAKIDEKKAELARLRDESTPSIARDYCVGRHAIYRIKVGDNWAHVD